MSDEKKPEDFERRDPEQRRLFTRIAELVVHLATRTKLAVIKYVFRSIEEDIKEEDKKDDN